MSERLKKSNNTKNKKQVVKPDPVKQKIKQEQKTLSAMEERQVLSILDNESTAENLDAGIVERMQNLKLNKDLVIEFIIKQYRDLERKFY